MRGPSPSARFGMTRSVVAHGWVARASRMLVSASRRNGLLLWVASPDDSALKKVRDHEDALASTETRTLPLDFLRRLRIKNAVETMRHSLLGVLRVIVSVGLVWLVAGCGEDPRYSARTQYLGGVYGEAPPGGPRDTVSYWDGDNVNGSPSVKISLGEQRAYFYKGGVLVGVSQLSTGREGLNTPTGTFKIVQKDKDHVSSLFGDYVDSAGNVVVPNVDIKKDPKPPGAHFRGTPMPYFMRIVSGTGMHAGYLPGYPASHGCIRMPEFMAEDFFRSVSVGTPVTITN